MTLVEVCVALAVSSVVGLIAAGLFKAGVVSSSYSIRQGFVLGALSQAVTGTPYRRGLAWALRDGIDLQGLSPNELHMRTRDALSVRYFIQDRALHREEGGVSRKQAQGVTGLAVTYYNLDETGRIFESTSAASAALVAARIDMAGRGREKSYAFYVGARLRNRP